MWRVGTGIKAKRIAAVVSALAVSLAFFVIWRVAERKAGEYEAEAARRRVEIPLITTRGHLREGTLTPGRGRYDYETEGEIPGLTGISPAPADLFVIIHGLNNSSAKAIYKFGIARDSLRKPGNGFRGGIVGFSWDADTSKDPFGATGYHFAKAHAVANGPKLARFLADYKARNPRSKVRLLGYSMGARVALEAVHALATDPAFAGFAGKIDSLHLVGAAVDNEEVETDERYGKPIEKKVVTLINYYSPRDDKLGKYYRVTDGDRALGRSDIEHADRKPVNYRSRDVQSELKAEGDTGDVDEAGQPGDNHSGYLGIRNKSGTLVDDGVMDVVLRDIRGSQADRVSSTTGKKRR